MELRLGVGPSHPLNTLASDASLSIARRTFPMGCRHGLTMRAHRLIIAAIPQRDSDLVVTFFTFLGTLLLPHHDS